VQEQPAARHRSPVPARSAGEGQVGHVDAVDLPGLSSSLEQQGQPEPAAEADVRGDLARRNLERCGGRGDRVQVGLVQSLRDQPTSYAPRMTERGRLRWGLRRASASATTSGGRVENTAQVRLRVVAAAYLRPAVPHPGENGLQEIFGPPHITREQPRSAQQRR